MTNDDERAPLSWLKGKKIVDIIPDKRPGYLQFIGPKCTILFIAKQEDIFDFEGDHFEDDVS
jgi:hypothetical protein